MTLVPVFLMENHEQLKKIIISSMANDVLKEKALTIIEQLVKEKNRNDFLIKRLKYDKTTTQRFLNKTVEELEKNNKSIIEKNKELEQFNYIASHDMQEPLRTIISLVDLLNKKYINNLDATGQKSLIYIKDSTQRMSNLIKSLLQYSRIGHSGEPQNININMLIDEIAEDLTANIKENNVLLNYNNLPTVYGFKTELKLLFQNLISNAIKFKKKNIRPVIEIVFKKTTNYWQFKIIDNGIGVRAEYQNKIFKIFQRLHVQSKYSGTGIGLAHCKKIVELHKGKIWCESEPDVGSTFIFQIKTRLNKP